MKVTASAPGKINLFFTVGEKLEDGYHEVVSVYQALNLRETVTVERADGFSLEVSGITAGVPTDQSNLAAKAVAYIDSSPVAISIHKQVPVAGGMGGGSADAAAALVAASKLFDTPFELEATVSLGADVPFAVQGGTAIGVGRGEILTALDAPTTLHWVLVPASVGLSTPEVYRTLDEIRPVPVSRDPEPLIAALRNGNPIEIAKHLHNDLQQAALHLLPALQETIDALEAAGALKAMVSGSGPTVLALAANLADAERIAKACNGIATTGPAAGAHA